MLLIALTPNMEGAWFVLPNRAEGGAVVPFVVAGFPNKLPPPNPLVVCWFCGCPRVPPPNIDPVCAGVVEVVADPKSPVPGVVVFWPKSPLPS